MSYSLYGGTGGIAPSIFEIQYQNTTKIGQSELFFGFLYEFISKRVARILYWGWAQKMHFYKELTTFFSRRPQNLSSPSSRVHLFWHILGPQNTSGRENSVTLLNKAGPTSQQSQFFIVKFTESTIAGGAVGHAPNCSSVGLCAQDYRSLHVAVMMLATLVNTQTHTQTVSKFFQMLSIK